MIWPIAEDFISSYEMLVTLDVCQLGIVGDEGWAEILRCLIVDRILLPLLSSPAAGLDYTDLLTRSLIIRRSPLSQFG